jgi:hypothetical protein
MSAAIIQRFSSLSNLRTGLKFLRRMAWVLSRKKAGWKFSVPASRTERPCAVTGAGKVFLRNAWILMLDVEDRLTAASWTHTRACHFEPETSSISEDRSPQHRAAK